MLYRMHICLLTALLLLSISQPVLAQEPDSRMQVAIVAEDAGVDVRWLHAHIQKAAAMALPQLWNRLIPRHAHQQIPKNVNALLFLKKATPTANGVHIVFDQKRVLSYLEKHNIPYYAEQSGGSQAMIAPAASASFGYPTMPQLRHGILSIERQASLPEQVMFEDDLRRNPHVAGLSLKQVNKQGRQYRLALKSPDDQWLSAWFKRRGMTLTASADGWLVR